MSEFAVYLDYNATTPVDPRVLQAMLPYLTAQYGNPSSGHPLGQRARAAVEQARNQVALLLGCKAEEIVFTSGGSESNNMAIKGIAYAARESGRGSHIVTSVVEHPAVSKPLDFLRKQGFQVSAVPVDEFGRVDVADVRDAVRRDTILITVMHANNEVGTIQPIADIATIARERGVPFHSDAAQTVGKLPVDVTMLGVDLLTVAGHKLYAPKGVGALFISQNRALQPLIHGAAHESGRRAGTENVAGIVGLGLACEIAGQVLELAGKRMTFLRDRLHQGLLRLNDRIVLNGHPTERLPNTLNVSFPGGSGADILAQMDGVAASTGSACHDRRLAISEVLLAMGAGQERGLGS
ncbi:MAG: cysteine desulfurase, partial [Chloroflexi bacterium]|nr:cysteine desulfurase [Chloroflexota bacterium]